MNLQRTLSNGSKTDIATTDTERYITAAEKFHADHPNREILLKGFSSVREKLAAGKTVNYGTDWYESIQIKREPKPVPVPEMVKCNCGHTVSRVSVMSASMGTSCPDCYDRMSE